MNATDEWKSLISVRNLTLAVHSACSCGGGGPDDGCPACQVYHFLMDIYDREPLGERPEFISRVQAVVEAGREQRRRDREAQEKQQMPATTPRWTDLDSGLSLDDLARAQGVQPVRDVDAIRSPELAEALAEIDAIAEARRRTCLRRRWFWRAFFLAVMVAFFGALALVFGEI